MSDKLREAAQFALETLEDVFGKDKIDVGAINNLRAALAEPEQEPVAWITKGGKGDLWWSRSVDEDGNNNLDDVPLYAAPLAEQKPMLEMNPEERPWVGLTGDEITQNNRESLVDLQAWKEAVSWAEAKLREKNGG